MLQLHSHPLSTFGRRVDIALLEKNIQVDRVVVDMPQGAHRKPPYLKLNPFGRVPTLVDGDFVLPESTAILEYLEATFPEPALVPDDPQGRALVSLHMKWCDIEFAAHAHRILFPKRFIAQEKWRRQELATAKAAIERFLPILDQQLQGKTYLVRERYSLADLCYVPFVHFMELLDVAPPAHVSGWIDRLLARPSSKATVPAM